jgi:hypothetical protein
LPRFAESLKDIGQVMKNIFLPLLFAISLATSAKSEFAMLGFGKESCSEMVITTSTGSQMDQVYKFAYTAYILGFFTGVNAMENKDTGLEEIDTLYKSTREYCEKHPSDNIFDAMIRVLSQIRD